MVGLCHQPIAKKLIVKVNKAMNIFKSDSKSESDPYVEITLWHKNELVGSPQIDMHKTAIHVQYAKRYYKS